MLRIRGTFLRSAVGRRIFALFLFASIIPIALLAAVTYRGVANLMERQSAAELNAYSKSYGMEVYARLRAAQSALARAVPARDTGAAGPVPTTIEGAPIFSGISRADAAMRPLPPPARTQWPAVGPHFLEALAATAAFRSLRPGEDLLVALPGEAETAAVIAMAVRRDDGTEPAGYVVGVLNPGYAFGEGDPIAAGTDICVSDAAAGRVLFCSDPALAAALADAGEHAPAPAARGSWTLPPTTSLKFGKWTFTALRASGVGVLGDRQIERTYVAVIAACVVLVALLSLVQIRRTLVPLERLIEATRRVAAADFSQPIVLDRPDEFGQLSVAFNDMSRALESQIAALRTLSSIDQEILSALDVERIIDRVLMRVEQLLPEGIIAIARSPATTADGMPVTVWRSRAGSREQLSVAIGAAERDAWAGGAAIVQRGGPPAGGQALARCLFDAGARAGVLLPVQTRNRSWVVLALGSADGRLADSSVLDQARELVKRVGVAVDACEREAQLKDEARSDHLTGLPNRLRVHEIIERRAARADDATSFAVMFIDLDRFKSVNDGLGHDAGDALLVEAARRIVDCLGERDVVARLGGDEFIVVTDAVDPPALLDDLAQCIIQTIAQTFHVGPVEVHVGASIGIALYPQDGRRREDLIRNADTAMYRAKESGRGRHVRFQESMGRDAFEILALEEDLRQALHRGDIRVHFQPRVSLADGRVVSAEALARWTHPQRGPVAPDHFIRLAEDIGVIDVLGESVLAQTCALLAELDRRGQAAHPISVNLSSRQLQDPRACARLRAIVQAAGVSPARIELEITESALLDDLALTCVRLDELRAFGFAIALDDFGTGYSSLSYLQRLPIDVMKVDRSFVRDIETSNGSRAIAVAIIGMAHTLGLRVVAEGVETVGQARLLREWGCNEAQGFLYARPMPGADFARFVAAAPLAIGVGA